MVFYDVGGTMSSLQEIIKQAQKDLFCPTCGRSFNLSEIRLRGIFNHSLVLQTVCTNGHSPVIMIFVTAYYKDNIELNPISFDDVISENDQMANFKGDFQSLWAKKKNK